MFQLQDSAHFISEQCDMIVKALKKKSSALAKFPDKNCQEITALASPSLISLYARSQAYPRWIDICPASYNGYRMVYISDYSPYRKSELSNATLYMACGKNILFESNINKNPQDIDAHLLADAIGKPECEAEIYRIWTSNYADKATTMLEDIFGFPLRFPEDRIASKVPYYEGYKLKIFNFQPAEHLKPLFIDNENKTTTIANRVGFDEKYASIHVKNVSDKATRQSIDEVLPDDCVYIQSDEYLSIYCDDFRSDSISRYAKKIAQNTANKLVISISQYEDMFAFAIYQGSARLIDVNWDKGSEVTDLVTICDMLDIPRFHKKLASIVNDDFLLEMERIMGVIF